MRLATIDPHSQKKHTFTKSPCLVLIRLGLTEIQRFIKVKFNKEMYGHLDTVSGQTASRWPYISL